MGQTTRLADIALTFVAERGVARISFQDISGSDLTFSCLMTYIYMSYRTANLQMLHFIYLFNKYTY